MEDSVLKPTTRQPCYNARPTVSVSGENYAVRYHIRAQGQKLGVH